MNNFITQIPGLQIAPSHQMTPLEQLLNFNTQVQKPITQTLKYSIRDNTISIDFSSIGMKLDKVQGTPQMTLDSMKVEIARLFSEVLDSNSNAILFSFSDQIDDIKAQYQITRDTKKNEYQVRAGSDLRKIVAKREKDWPFVSVPIDYNNKERCASMKYAADIESKFFDTVTWCIILNLLVESCLNRILLTWYIKPSHLFNSKLAEAIKLFEDSFDGSKDNDENHWYRYGRYGLGSLILFLANSMYPHINDVHSERIWSFRNILVPQLWPAIIEYIINQSDISTSLLDDVFDILNRSFDKSPQKPHCIYPIIKFLEKLISYLGPIWFLSSFEDIILKCELVIDRSRNGFGDVWEIGIFDLIVESVHILRSLNDKYLKLYNRIGQFSNKLKGKIDWSTSPRQTDVLEFIKIIEMIKDLPEKEPDVNSESIMLSFLRRYNSISDYLLKTMGMNKIYYEAGRYLRNAMNGRRKVSVKYFKHLKIKDYSDNLSSVPIRYRKCFYSKSILKESEDEFIEYKNWKMENLQNYMYDKLIHVIFGMANAIGGVILIGVEERIVNTNMKEYHVRGIVDIEKYIDTFILTLNKKMNESVYIEGSVPKWRCEVCPTEIPNAHVLRISVKKLPINSTVISRRMKGTI